MKFSLNLLAWVAITGYAANASSNANTGANGETSTNAIVPCERSSYEYVNCGRFRFATNSVDEQGNTYRVCSLEFSPFKRTKSILALPNTNGVLADVKYEIRSEKTPSQFPFWIRESDGQMITGATERDQNGLIVVPKNPVCYTMSSSSGVLTSVGCQPGTAYSKFEVDGRGAVYVNGDGQRYRLHFGSGSKVRYELCR